MAIRNRIGREVNMPRKNAQIDYSYRSADEYTLKLIEKYHSLRARGKHLYLLMKVKWEVGHDFLFIVK